MERKEFKTRGFQVEEQGAMMESLSLRCRAVQVLSGFVYSKMRVYLFSLSLEFLPKIEQKEPHVLYRCFALILFIVLLRFSLTLNAQRL